jgi:hypothetical protein
LFKKRVDFFKNSRLLSKSRHLLNQTTNPGLNSQVTTGARASSPVRRELRARTPALRLPRIAGEDARAPQQNGELQVCNIGVKKKRYKAS